MPVTEAVFENGVLKPMVVEGFKEHQRYRLIWQEHLPPIWPEEPEVDPEFAAELERRTTILPDGRRVIRLGGLWEKYLPDIPDGEDWVADTLAELRRERAQHFDEEWPEIEPDSTAGATEK